MKIAELIQSLSDDQVQYVLVGGLAVQLHGYLRSTFDIDLVLAMNDANLARFISVAKRHGLLPVIPVLDLAIVVAIIMFAELKEDPDLVRPFESRTGKFTASSRFTFPKITRSLSSRLRASAARANCVDATPHRLGVVSVCIFIS